MLIDLLRALQAGKELANAKTWKKAQVWTSNLTILLGAAVSIAAAYGYAIPLGPDQITTLVSAAAVLLGLFNSYTTVATTERLGVPPRPDPVDPGTADPGGYASATGSSDAGLWFNRLDDRGFDDVPILKDEEK
jgi:hypothetical protein